MLPKSKRLNLKHTFRWVSQGTRNELLHFKVYYRYGENENVLVGIALTSAYFKKANMRNKARRIASKAIESIYPGLNKGLNLVIMPKANIFNAPLEELKAELNGIKNIVKFN